MTVAKFGAFGKIPSVGDFFRLNAPPGFESVWDNWLQRCLLSGAQTYGEQWDALYMSVPIWRFCLAEGVAGPNPILGILMPSVDRVGRRFPLTLMVPLQDNASALRFHLNDSETFVALEDIALSVLDDEISKDVLDEKLSNVPMPETSGKATCWEAEGGALGCKGVDATSLLSGVTDGLLTRSFQAPTIWSSLMEHDSRLMICSGLPVGSNMQALFDLDAEFWKEAIS